MLAPSEVALFFANGPAHGVWSDNVLVLAHPRGKPTSKEQAKELPDLLKQEDPNCEVLSCQVVTQGARSRPSRPSSAPAAARSR